MKIYGPFLSKNFAFWRFLQISHSLAEKYDFWFPIKTKTLHLIKHYIDANLKTFFEQIIRHSNIFLRISHSLKKKYVFFQKLCWWKFLDLFWVNNFEFRCFFVFRIIRLGNEIWLMILLNFGNTVNFLIMIKLKNVRFFDLKKIVFIKLW